MVEFSGAAAVAAFPREPQGNRRGRVAAVLSGGNLDPSLMGRLARDGEMGLAGEMCRCL